MECKCKCLLLCCCIVETKETLNGRQLNGAERCNLWLIVACIALMVDGQSMYCLIWHKIEIGAFFFYLLEKKRKNSYDANVTFMSVTRNDLEFEHLFLWGFCFIWSEFCSIEILWVHEEAMGWGQFCSECKCGDWCSVCLGYLKTEFDWVMHVGKFCYRT